MSFQQGLSGLSAASKNLDVIGNNVANANTVGFKQSQTQFADIFANSLSGGGGSQAGIGVKVTGIAQQFGQGSVTASGNPLDIAINGGGFYRLSDQNDISYSRNGQFQTDKDGYIVNRTGLRLTGYPANTAGQINTAAPVDLQISKIRPATWLNRSGKCAGQSGWARNGAESGSHSIQPIRLPITVRPQCQSTTAWATQARCQPISSRLPPTPGMCSQPMMVPCSMAAHL